jgi:hypothetical protein
MRAARGDDDESRNSTIRVLVVDDYEPFSRLLKNYSQSTASHGMRRHAWS